MSHNDEVVELMRENAKLREALQWIETKSRLASNVDVIHVYGIHREIADTARAALTERHPPPKDGFINDYD